MSKNCNGDYSHSFLKFINNTICIQGEITPETAKSFLSVEEKENTYIVLNSPGGDVSAAIDIATRIFERHLNVVVDKICISSCANYLFPSGNLKFVIPGGLLGFHGGPGQGSTITYVGPERLRESAILEVHDYTKLLLEKQGVLYSEIGLDANLIYVVPLPVPNNFEASRSFWVYDRARLLHYGINNIILYSGPGDRSLLDQALAYFNGFSCHRINQDAWICV